MRRLPYVTATALAVALAGCSGDDDPAPTVAGDDPRTAAASPDLPPRLDELSQAFGERGHDVRPIDTSRSQALDPPRPENAVRVEFPARDLTVRAYRSPRAVRAQVALRRDIPTLLVREQVNEIIGCGRYLYFGPDAAMASKALDEALRAAGICRGGITIGAIE